MQPDNAYQAILHKERKRRHRDGPINLGQRDLVRTSQNAFTQTPVCDTTISPSANWPNNLLITTAFVFTLPARYSDFTFAWHNFASIANTCTAIEN